MTERLVSMFKKMIQGESWLLPRAAPAEREEDSACDRQECTVYLDVVQGELIGFYHVCIKLFPLIINAFLFQLP